MPPPVVAASRRGCARRPPPPHVLRRDRRRPARARGWSAVPRPPRPALVQAPRPTRPAPPPPLARARPCSPPPVADAAGAARLARARPRPCTPMPAHARLCPPMHAVPAPARGRRGRPHGGAAPVPRRTRPIRRGRGQSEAASWRGAAGGGTRCLQPTTASSVPKLRLCELRPGFVLLGGVEAGGARFCSGDFQQG
nr:uncharacterized protein LOC127303465 [Lolium perenne]